MYELSNVLIAGCKNDSNLIYMDPEKGFLVIGEESMFGAVYKYVISGIK